jgi:hypothetical protein
MAAVRVFEKLIGVGGIGDLDRDTVRPVKLDGNVVNRLTSSR